jgi:hypothetical protein
MKYIVSLQVAKAFEIIMHLWVFWLHQIIYVLKTLVIETHLQIDKFVSFLGFWGQAWMQVFLVKK